MKNYMQLDNKISLYQGKNEMWVLILETDETIVDLAMFQTKVEALVYFVQQYATKKAA